jgi:hypothetical protein
VWRHSADAAVSAAADNEGTPKPEYIIQSLVFILCSTELCFRIGSLLFHCVACVNSVAAEKPGVAC